MSEGGIAYDTERYRPPKWWSLACWHWRLNPGLAFNEVLLGQRVPRDLLVDQQSSAPLMERQFVPCSRCGAMNDGRLWAGTNAFSHWLGLFCPACGDPIPSLTNVLSYLLYAVLAPIWWPLRLVFGERFVAWDKGRLARRKDAEPPSAKKIHWWMMGGGWGGAMFLAFLAFTPHQRLLGPPAVLGLAAICAAGGAVFALAMKAILTRRR